jgi:gluconate 2-dehydrogenase subunit 3-like protein
MKSTLEARRDFLLQAGGLAGTAWISAQWPAVLAAAQHSHQAVKAKGSQVFEVLTPDQAKQIDAISSQIIPSDELPGAHEAGVVYFIDRALKTFASHTRPVYEKGLADVAKVTAELFPGVRTISDATPEQKQQIVAELMSEMNPRPGPRRSTVALNADFPQTIWIHTLWGFLLDPEAGANRDYVGWKVIGRDPAHSFSPPFGFYDKDYPGWQASAPETDKR